MSKKRRLKKLKAKLKAKLKGEGYVGDDTEAMRKKIQELLKDKSKQQNKVDSLQYVNDSLKTVNDSLMQVTKIRLK